MAPAKKKKNCTPYCFQAPPSFWPAAEQQSLALNDLDLLPLSCSRTPALSPPSHLCFHSSSLTAWQCWLVTGLGWSYGAGWSGAGRHKMACADQKAFKNPCFQVAQAVKKAREGIELPPTESESVVLTGTPTNHNINHF